MCEEDSKYIDEKECPECHGDLECTLSNAPPMAWEYTCQDCDKVFTAEELLMKGCSD